VIMLSSLMIRSYPEINDWCEARLAAFSSFHFPTSKLFASLLVLRALGRSSFLDLVSPAFLGCSNLEIGSSKDGGKSTPPSALSRVGP
jgi:hypothetical protein